MTLQRRARRLLTNGSKARLCLIRSISGRYKLRICWPANFLAVNRPDSLVDIPYLRLIEGAKKTGAHMTMYWAPIISRKQIISLAWGRQLF
jgi:hypothetical protein